MNGPRLSPAQTRGLAIIILLISACVIAVTVFLHRQPPTHTGAGVTPLHLSGLPAATGEDPTAGNHRETPSRDDSAERVAQRLAALDLAQRMSAKAGTLVHESMSDDGGEKFPQDLLQELSHMNEEQFRIAALSAGKNEATSDVARTILVSSMTNAWLHEHPDGGKKEMRILLGVTEDLLPFFCRGFDSLPIAEMTRRGSTWDPEDTTAFLVKHWDRWAGPAGDSNMDQVRHELAQNLQDPRLREQLEALPKAGNN